jgi:hypothetical protein
MNQRQKNHIVSLLNNPDISIRRRALEEISSLIDGNNGQ